MPYLLVPGIGVFTLPDACSNRHDEAGFENLVKKVTATTVDNK